MELGVLLEKISLDENIMKNFLQLIESCSGSKETDDLEEFLEKNVMNQLEEEEYDTLLVSLTEGIMNGEFVKENKEIKSLKEEIENLKNMIENLKKSNPKEDSMVMKEKKCPECKKDLFESGENFICEDCKKAYSIKEEKLEEAESGVFEAFQAEKDFEKEEADVDLILESESYRNRWKELKEEKEEKESKPVVEKKLEALEQKVDEKFEKILEKLNALTEKNETEDEGIFESLIEKVECSSDLEEVIQSIKEGNLSVKEGFDELESLGYEALKEDESEYEEFVKGISEKINDVVDENDKIFIEEEEDEYEEENSTEIYEFIIEEATKDLAETQKVQVNELIEGIDFEDEEDFKKQLNELIEGLTDEEQGKEEDKVSKRAKAWI